MKERKKKPQNEQTLVDERVCGTVDFPKPNKKINIYINTHIWFIELLNHAELILSFTKAIVCNRHIEFSSKRLLHFHPHSLYTHTYTQIHSVCVDSIATRIMDCNLWKMISSPFNECHTASHKNKIKSHANTQKSY